MTLGRIKIWFALKKNRFSSGGLFGREFIFRCGEKESGSFWTCHYAKNAKRYKEEAVSGRTKLSTTYWFWRFFLLIRHSELSNYC